MKVKLLLLNFLISVVAANAQRSNLHLVQSENIYSRIEQARVDSKNSIIEIETGFGIYYFDLKSGRLLTKFGGTDWADYGTSMICDSLLSASPIKFSSDSLLSLDSLQKIFNFENQLNFKPINRGINIIANYANDGNVNDIEITNNSCGLQGTYLVCEEDNPLHLLIKNFWFIIKSIKDIAEEEKSFSRYTLSLKDTCSYVINYDSAPILYNTTLKQVLELNNLIRYSKENKKYFFNEGFILISPDSSKLLYRSHKHSDEHPFILFDLKNNSIVSVFRGEACNIEGYQINERKFSENVISFSGDSKFIIIGNRLFNTYDGSEVLEYYRWLRINDKDLLERDWKNEIELDYINWLANFTFFIDSTNICIVRGEKLNFFNLNNLNGTKWQIPKDENYILPDSIALELNNIDIQKFLEFPTQGELDKPNAIELDFQLCNDSSRIEWNKGSISMDVLDTYLTPLDSNFYSDLFENAGSDLKKKLLNPEGLKSYMRDLRINQLNSISVYYFSEFFVTINDEDIIFWNSTCTKKLLCIRLYQDNGSALEARINRIDFDLNKDNFIYSTGQEVYVVPEFLIKEYDFKVPKKLSQLQLNGETINMIWKEYKEMLSYGIMNFPFDEVNNIYPYNPIWIECEKDGEIIRQNQLDVVGVECSKEGNVLISFSDNSSCLFDSSFKLKARIKSVDFGRPMSAGFIDDYNLIYYPSGNSIRFFDLSGKYLFDLFDENEIFLSNGYYSFSKEFIRKNHFVTNDLKVIGFDQLDPVYNRPDIVLDSIGKYFGGSDKDLVANYRAAWEKRIERLGLDKDKLSSGEIAVPNAEITNANQIQFENKVGKVVIHVEANDPKYTLLRYNVLVNEVPIYGSAGVSIADLNTQVWEHTDTITLSKGRNKIQVSIMNELGLENFKYPVYVNYSPEEIVSSKTYYVGIGVNHFKDASHDLKYCVNDVQDLARAFANNQSRVDTILFTDQEVTKENILVLKSYLQDNTTVNDKVIISCSSHGLLDDSLNFYLATYDVDFSNPKERGLKYEELESLLDGIPARQKLLLLDACNSGENERMFIEKNKSNNLAMNDTKKKGVDIEIANQEITSFQKMNELFVNVRNNTGSVIISAAGGLQSALEAIEVEGKEIENGAFTFSVLECLNRTQDLKVNDLKLYVEKRVEEITKGKQKPTSRQETMEVDWEVR